MTRVFIIVYYIWYLVPGGPGWGIKLDKDALNKFATGDRIVL